MAEEEKILSEKETTNLTEGTEGDDAGTSVAEGTTPLGEKIAGVVIIILVFVCIRFLPKKLILNLKEVEEEYD